MKRLSLVLMATMLILAASGCGSQQGTETVRIPKYDPDKTTTDANGKPAEKDPAKTGSLEEPPFPKATPATEWTMLRRTPDNLGLVDADIKLPLKKGENEFRIIPFGAPQTNTIWGSPAVINDKIYFGCSIGYISCNKFSTSEPIWKNQNPLDQIVSHFAVNDKMVFFGSAKGGSLYAYDLYADILMWSFKTGDNISAPPGLKPDDNIRKGVITDGPKLVDDRIFFGSWDGKMYCLDVSDGSEVWSYPTKAKIYGSAVSDGKVFFSNFSGEVVCLDASSGSLVWKIQLPKGTLSYPIVFGPRLWIGCRDSKLYCISTLDGKTLWSYQSKDTEKGIESCPAIDEKYVYSTTTGGQAFALDRITGKELWKADVTKSSLHSDPLVVRDKIIAPDMDGTVFILDKATGKTLDSFHATGSNPAFKAAPIIIGNEIVLSCYDSNVYILSGQ